MAIHPLLATSVFAAGVAIHDGRLVGPSSQAAGKAGAGVVVGVRPQCAASAPERSFAGRVRHPSRQMHEIPAAFRFDSGGSGDLTTACCAVHHPKQMNHQARAGRAGIATAARQHARRWDRRALSNANRCGERA
jgi:hypothetical protein